MLILKLHDELEIAIGQTNAPRQWVQDFLTKKLNATFELSLGPHGKPRLLGRRETFNISHSQDLLAVVFSRTGRPVGIDIECHRKIAWEKLAAKYLPMPVTSKATFFDCWAAQEAFVKAHGGSLKMGRQMPFGGEYVSISLPEFSRPYSFACYVLSDKENGR